MNDIKNNTKSCNELKIVRLQTKKTIPSRKMKKSLSTSSKSSSNSEKLKIIVYPMTPKIFYIIWKIEGRSNKS